MLPILSTILGFIFGKRKRTPTPACADMADCCKNMPYKLLKDLPGVKAGTIFYYYPKFNTYAHFKGNREVIVFPPQVVEIYKEWFYPLGEQEGEQWWV